MAEDREREEEGGEGGGGATHEGSGATLIDALAALVGGRVDGVYVSPATGLVALSIYTGEKRILGVGVGPDVMDVGFLPRPPRVRAGSSHPLVAAMRAHLVGQRVLRAGIDEEGTIEVSVSGPPGASAGLLLRPGRGGYARIVGAGGEVIVGRPLPAERPSAERSPGQARAVGGDPESVGLALVERSDALAAERAKAGLARVVKARLHALRRRADAVFGDLDRLSGIDRLQRIGRMLLAQGSQIPRGATKAILEDWEAGGTIEVTLDPARPAKAQAAAFFTRARRYRRGEAIMWRRLEETERALAEVKALLEAIAAAPSDVEALDALTERARSIGVGDAPDVATAGRRSRAAPRLPYTLYRSAGARSILVGRSARDNDALTTRHARPHDLWLHAKGTTGAHVVVPLEKGTSCPPEVLVDAATLAAHFSDARSESVCEVSYAERRYVRKPRKSAPGAVIMDREKVIAVRIDASRLARLLAAKAER